MLHDSGPDSARPDEYEPACRLLLSHCTPEALPGRLQAALRMIETGEMRPEGLGVLRNGGKVVAAVAAALVPGGTGVIWPPQAEGPKRREREDRLARHAVEWLRGRGACLAQAVLPVDEAHLAGPLLRHGFRHVTTLCYLGHAGEFPSTLLGTPARLDFEPFLAVDPAEFEATMGRTFEGTLDCPELAEARTVGQVVEGFRAQGIFDPARWWLAREGRTAVGVLLTSAVPPDAPPADRSAPDGLPAGRCAEESARVIDYVGVVPEGRRRGFGKELVLKALLEARAAGVPNVFLTVDVRNRPAWHLYRALDFEPFDRREVFLMVFGETSEKVTQRP